MYDDLIIDTDAKPMEQVILTVITARIIRIRDDDDNGNITNHNDDQKPI